MRVLVVTNPHATATTARARDVLAHALGSDADLEIAETGNRGHAAALACRAMRDGTDAVIALGGDGTVNEVVNGLLTDGVHPGVPSLGIVPAGSTNVFARSLGVPNDPVEATGALLDGLRAGTTRSVSLGLVDERWFVFAAGIGLDAAIVAEVEKRRRKGKKSTHALYARVGFREYLRMDRRHPKLHIDLADGTTVDDVYFAIVANADPWTFVGNRALHPTPDVTFENGLALYARRRMGALGMLIGMVLMSGDHPRVGRWGATVLHDLDGLTIRADERLPVHVDGDQLSPQAKLVFRTVPRAIRVIVAG